MRNDARIMNKLHRRVFLDKIGLEDVKIYISIYVEASNRDAFMAVKQVGSCPWQLHSFPKGYITPVNC